jgi:hypothetical protein
MRLSKAAGISFYIANTLGDKRFYDPRCNTSLYAFNTDLVHLPDTEEKQ